MINNKLRLAAAAAALLLLTACQSREEKEFFANKAIAESKSGVVYRTTYFAATAEADKKEGIPYPLKDGELYCLAYQNTDGDVIKLTPSDFTEARMGYEVDDGAM